MTAPASPADVLVERLRQAGVVFAEQEAGLLAASTADPEVLELRVERRAAGEPLEVVLGWAAFDGLRVPVRQGVFVPRPRSEALVGEADRLVRGRAAPAGPDEPLVVVDLCCGTGALGAALARRMMARGQRATLALADIDPIAVASARQTLLELDVPGSVHLGDLWQALPEDLRGQCDVVLANAPYVPSEQLELLPREAREHEPRHTLDGGVDGLEVVRRVALGASAWLAPEGILLSEVAAHQAPAGVAAWVAAGLAGTVERDGVMVGVWS